MKRSHSLILEQGGNSSHFYSLPYLQMQRLTLDHFGKCGWAIIAIEITKIHILFYEDII